jgi:hypothetical protein
MSKLQGPKGQALCGVFLSFAIPKKYCHDSRGVLERFFDPKENAAESNRIFRSW